MDTTHYQASKHQWRFERPHRVRLFAEHIPVRDTVNKHANEVYWEMATKFADTTQYEWATNNDVKLEWTYNDSAMDWHRTCMFYADLTEAQYVDYTLRFFDHHSEAWK